MKHMNKATYTRSSFGLAGPESEMSEQRREDRWCWSWVLPSWMTSMKQTEQTGNGMWFWTIKARPQWHTHSHKVTPAKPPPNSTTYWGPSTQTPEPMGMLSFRPTPRGFSLATRIVRHTTHEVAKCHKPLHLFSVGVAEKRELRCVWDSVLQVQEPGQGALSSLGCCAASGAERHRELSTWSSRQL